MDSFIDNCRGIIVALVIALVFALFICFCNTIYCVSEIDILKEYHSNTCSECGQAK